MTLTANQPAMYRQMEEADARSDRNLGHVREALLEAGVSPDLLRYDTVQPIYCHICDAGDDDSFHTDYVDDLVKVLEFIGLPYSAKPDENDILLDGDGGCGPEQIRPCGENYRYGLDYEREGRAQYNYDTWRLRHTDSVDDVHVTLLACAQDYWQRFPARLKTSNFLPPELCKVFEVTSVEDVPSAHLRQCARDVVSK